MNALELIEKLRSENKSKIDAINKQKQLDLDYLESNFTGVKHSTAAHVYQMAREKIMEVYEDRAAPLYVISNFLFGVQLDLLAPLNEHQ